MANPTWLKKLRPASFRGVSFLVETHGLAGGNRVDVIEYPEKSVSQVDELGRKTRRYSVSAFILGDDYMVGRDALLEAIERPGPGPLSHPYLGALTVVVGDSWRLSEGTDFGGMARFELEFIEKGERTFPRATVDQRTVTETQATAATAASAARATTAEAEAQRSPFYYRQRFSQFQHQESRALAAIAGAQIGPDDFVADIEGVLQRLTTAPALLRIAAHPFTFPLPGSLPSEVAAYDASVEWARHVRVSAAAAAATTALASPPDSYQAAAELGHEVADAIEAEELATTDPTLYEALAALRIGFVAALQERAADLPRERVIEVAGFTPDVVLAFDLYEDPTRGAEIVARNDIANPLFVGGAVTVLSE